MYKPTNFFIFITVLSCSSSTSTSTSTITTNTFYRHSQPISINSSFHKTENTIPPPIEVTKSSSKALTASNYNQYSNNTATIK
jgi:hypothetical protein